MALVFKMYGAAAQVMYAQPMYGPALDDPVPLYGPPIFDDMNLWSKIKYVLTYPITIFIIIALAIIIGIVVLIKQKKRATKKNNNLL